MAVHKLGPGPEAAVACLVSFYSLVLAGVTIAEYSMSWGQIGLSWLAGLGLLAAGQVLAIFLYRRAARGTWLMGPEAVEFRPLQGPERRIQWKDVQWVRWEGSQFILRGDACRIGLNRGFLTKSEWKEVRDRVESLLAGRFDLTIKPLPKEEVRWLRVLGLSLPAGLVTGLAMIGLATTSEGLLRVVMAAYLVVTLGIVFLYFWSTCRELERLNPTWRVAKSKAGDWDDWSL